MTASDELLTALTELAAQPDDNDILYIVDDPAGTPLDRKIKVSNLLLGPITDIAINETAIALNTTHRSSVGTDHGYIDQDLQVTASPTFAGLDLTEGNITNVGEIELDLIRADTADGSITIELDDAAGADLIVGNNNALVVEGDNDRVGIGIAAPSGKLHIQSSVNGLARSYLVNVNTGANRRQDLRIGTGTGATEGIFIGTDQSEVYGTGVKAYLANYSNGAFAFMTAAVPQWTITLGGNIGIGIITGVAAKTHIDQWSTTAAIPVLLLDQADISEGFINFVGTSAASAAGPISTWTAGNSIQGFVRVEINGTGYWMPYYDDPTA